MTVHNSEFALSLWGCGIPVRKFRKNVNTKHNTNTLKIDTHADGLKTKIKVLAANSKFQGYCVEPINQFNMKKSPK